VERQPCANGSSLDGAAILPRVTVDDPTLDPSDPYARQAQTFPRLTAEMAARVAAFGTEERFAAGAPLFLRGDRGVDFFLVLEGRVEVFELTPDGVPNVLVVHGDLEFTGDLDLFTEHRILVSGRAAVPTRVIRVEHADFRRLMSAEPDIGEIVMRAFILRRVGLIRHTQGAVLLIGSSACADTLRIQRFLTRNGYPHRRLDVDGDPEAAPFVKAYELGRERMPAVVHTDRLVLLRPTDAELADALGIAEVLDEAHVHDVVVVGAGPSGLAAAVYGASEGLDVLVIEGLAPGGQAGTSSKIENYLGFPTGISGQALAGRAMVQAQKFGARLAIARYVIGLECPDGGARQPGDARLFRLRLDDGKAVSSRAVVIATGARYRKLDLESFERFEGQGILYAATAMEEQLCVNEEVAIVGGGNSAGQAAMYLARRAAHVHILIRGQGLAVSMSDYLVQRIASSPKITLHPCSEITALAGDTSLRRVTWQNRVTGESQTHDIRNLFVMIGAAPNTEWLGECVELDAHGFVVTGRLRDAGATASPYATSRPGVWAVGDVRAGSVKRVASAVGEGSVVVQSIHGYLHPVPGAPA
jgi:thioredoxin reductase (NADPH)